MITPEEQKLDDLEYVKRCIDGAKNIVVLTGAGISTESGVPDFASLPDYFDEDEQVSYSRKDVMSTWFFDQKPDAFYAYMHKHFYSEEASPNRGHDFLAKLQKKHKVTIVTQNIDGLHEKTGSSNVIHYHGVLDKFYCRHCDFYGKAKDIHENEKGWPVHHYLSFADAKIEEHPVLPDIVLYGQQIDALVNFQAIQAFAQADLILVMGTAMEVYPAAGLVTSEEAKGKRKIFINKTQPPQPEIFDIILEGAIGEIVRAIPMDKKGNIIFGKTPEHQIKISMAKYKIGDIVKRSEFIYEMDKEGAEKFPDEEWAVREVDIDESEPDEPIVYLLSNRRYHSPEKYTITYALLKDCDFVSH